MRKTKLLGAATAVTLGLASAPAAADGSQPVCGQVITHSVTLTADLTGCPGNGLVVGAPNITIDLGGYTISGAPGNPAYGVNDQAGYPGLTVTDGTISGFFAGVDTDNNADNTVVSDLSTSSMVFASVVLKRSQGGEISHVTADATGQAQGLVLSGMTGAEIDHSVVFGSHDAGIYVYIGDGNIVDHNQSSSNLNQGIYVESATNTAVSNNQFDRNGGGGRQDGADVVGASAGTSLTNNHADGNVHDGIYSASSGVTLGGNHADLNANLGIDVVAGDTDAGNNHAFGNGNPLQCIGVTCLP